MTNTEDIIANETKRCIAAVLAEPEPGPMPDDIWALLSNDRNMMQRAFKFAVEDTKIGIIKRIVG